MDMQKFYHMVSTPVAPSCGYETDEQASRDLANALTRVVLTQPFANAVFRRYQSTITIDSLTAMVVGLADHASALMGELVSRYERDLPPELDAPTLSFSGVLDDAFQLIREFNRLTPGRSTRVSPVFPDDETRTILTDRIASEVQELRDAADEIAWVDAFTDILVVTMDAMCICGEHPSPFFADVMAANLRKRFPDGVMHTDEKGKVIKPEGWIGPEADIAKHLQTQKIYGYRNESDGTPSVPLSTPRRVFVVRGRCREEHPFYSLNPVEDAEFTDSISFTTITDAQARLTVLRDIAAQLVAVPRPTTMERHVILSLHNIPSSVHELSSLNVETCFQWTTPIQQE